MENDVKLKLSDIQKKGKNKASDLWYVKKVEKQAEAGDISLKLSDTKPTRAANPKLRQSRALFFGEFKQMRKSSLIWFAVIAGLCIITAATYPLMKVAFDALQDQFGSLPPDMVNIINEMIGAMDTFVKYYLTSAGLALMLALFGGIVASTMLTKDSKGNASEFLYAMPIKRTRIVVIKYAVLESIVVLFNLALLVISVVLALCFSGGEAIDYVAILAHIGSATLMSIVVSSLIFGLSLMSKKRVGFGVALGIVLIMYLILPLSAIDGLGFVRYLTPMSIPTVVGAPFEWIVSLIWLAVAAVAVAAGFLRFRKQDLV